MNPKVENFDILTWWKINSSKFTVLPKIARDVLTVPVSTVASESALVLEVEVWIHLGAL